MAARRTAPTLADVAAEVGVSQATASRALADSPLVNENTRRRVWEAAERLRFEPNRLASALRRGATMAVGVVVPDVAAAFYATALAGAQDALESAGYHVLVLNTGRAAERERVALRTLRAHRVDGLLVATSGGYEDIGVPTVFFDNVPEVRGAGAVAIDNELGVRRLVEHLAGIHGHERIAYIGPPEAPGTGAGGLLQGVGRERLEAFRAAVGRAGLALPPEYVRTGDVGSFEEDARAAAREMMALERPPTAFIGGADTFATGLLRGLREARRRVPEDVALVSFDEPVSADLLDPPMTSLDRHDRELGRVAAEVLLGSLREGEDRAGEIVRLEVGLSVRRSCGCDLTDPGP